MRRFFQVVGAAVSWLAWLGLFVFWVIAMRHWLGGWGTLLAFVLSPGIVLFPLVYWGVEGSFPWVYFVLWGVAWLGMVLPSLGSSAQESRVRILWLRLRRMRANGSEEPDLKVVVAGGRYGFADKRGKMVIEPQFDEAEAFSEGLAAVHPDSFGPWGYIDSQGAWVITPTYDRAGSFAEGVAAVEIGGHTGFISRSGGYAIQPTLPKQATSLFHFSEGVARLADGDKWGYIDTSGAWSITPQFERAWEFTDGLAAVRVDDQWGFIKKDGTFAAKPQFEAVGNFAEGLAAACRSDKWGYIDKTGRFVIPATFEFAGSFGESKRGLAEVTLHDRWANVDKRGRIVKWL